MKIAIIDDLKDQRETMAGLMRTVVSDNWEVIDMDPFENLEDYPAFINEQDVAVILLDEKLKTSSTVEYEGHDLVKYIRERLHTLPIYVVTSFEADSELAGSFSDVEQIISRQDFSDNIDKYYPRIMRAGQHFIEDFKKDLSDLNTMTQKIVMGTADGNDIQQVQAIQTKLNLAFSPDEFNKRSLILEQLEEKLNGFSEIKNEIDDLLNNNEVD